MADVAPKLYKSMQTAFDNNLSRNRKAASLMRKIESGAATYKDAGDYADQVGKSLANAIKANVSGLPDGKMYWNIAERTVKPLYQQEYQMTSSAAATVQQGLNRKAKIGLKPLKATMNDDLLKGIMDMYCATDDLSQAEEVYETAESFARTGVDETLKANADFQFQCGRTPRIVRRAGDSCCSWCAELEGVYDYPNVPGEVFARHDNCKCSVDYDPGSLSSKNGKTQDVWSKTWQDMSTDDEKAIRQTIGLDRSVDKEMLKTFNLE